MSFITNHTSHVLQAPRLVILHMSCSFPTVYIHYIWKANWSASFSLNEKEDKQVWRKRYTTEKVLEQAYMTLCFCFFVEV